jgi:hypothetical protein
VPHPVQLWYDPRQIKGLLSYSICISKDTQLCGLFNEVLLTLFGAAIIKSKAFSFSFFLMPF